MGRAQGCGKRLHGKQRTLCPKGIRLASSPCAATAASCRRRSASCLAASSPNLACGEIRDSQAAGMGMQGGGAGTCSHGRLKRAAVRPGFPARPRQGPPGQAQRELCTHPQPPNLCLLLQAAFLNKLERGAGAALHAAQRAGAEPRIEEPAGSGATGGVRGERAGGCRRREQRRGGRPGPATPPSLCCVLFIRLLLLLLRAGRLAGRLLGPLNGLASGVHLAPLLIQNERRRQLGRGLGRRRGSGGGRR